MPPLKRLKSITIAPESNQEEYKKLDLSEYKVYIKCQNVNTMLAVRTGLTAAEVVSFLSEAVADLQAWDVESSDAESQGSEASSDVSTEDESTQVSADESKEP